MSVQTNEITTEEVCRTARRDYQLARDHFRRANRNLAETAAVMIASLTAVSAIGAVINIAVDQAGLPTVLEIQGSPFNLPLGLLLVYIAIVAIIFAFGFLRIILAFLNRWRAERQIDWTKMKIFEFCPEDLWPEFEG